MPLDFNIELMPDLIAMQEEINLADEIHFDEVAELKEQNKALQQIVGRLMRTVETQSKVIKGFRG